MLGMRGVSATALPMSTLPTSHPPVSFGKIGLLLVNLGTPDSTSHSDIRRYLREFLSDRRVIEVNPLLWWCILNGPILAFRPRKAAHAYSQIWKTDTNESPLRFYTREQSRLLAEQMGTDSLIVDWAMRYGNPSIASRLDALREQGCTRIAVLPLYPQYAAATTATVADEVFRCLMKLRWQPTLRMAEPYHDHPHYIEALAASIKSHMASLAWQPEVILASFHGIPKRYFDAGDPYSCYCHKTARLLREALGMDESQLRITFQSRFGREAWLKPYTSDVIEQLAADGVKRLAIIAPGFSADCVETLEEVDIGLRELFLERGGGQFTTVPCLNDSDNHIALLQTLSQRVLSGWL